MGRLRESMRPEFLNRIDEIVMFRKLDREQLREIVGLLLGRTRDRLATREVTLEVAPTAIEWLAEHGYEPEYGARPLRRVIQRELDDRIAELFVSGALTDGGTVQVEANGGRARRLSRGRGAGSSLIDRTRNGRPEAQGRPFRVGTDPAPHGCGADIARPPECLTSSCPRSVSRASDENARETGVSSRGGA